MSYHFQDFSTLPLRHKYMFGQVFQKPQICQLFLEELLGWSIEKIEYVDREKDITDSYFSRGVRLDIYIRNSNVVYNVEMQSDKDDALERRIRYYQSGIDREELKHGVPHKFLPETFIIFICNYDPLGHGYAVYHRQMLWDETQNSYSDGTHAIVLNSHYTKGNASPAILEVLDYIRTNDDGKEYSTDLARRTKEQVHQVRLDKELGGKYMLLELMMQEKRENGRMEMLVELICKKLKKGKTPEVIADEVEGDPEFILFVCKALEPYAPNYDMEQIYETLIENHFK